MTLIKMTLIIKTSSIAALIKNDIGLMEWHLTKWYLMYHQVDKMFFHRDVSFFTYYP
jgi:hypothetical protein